MKKEISNMGKKKNRKGTFKFAEMLSKYSLKKSWAKQHDNFLLIAKIMDSQERVLKYVKNSSGR